MKALSLFILACLFIEGRSINEEICGIGSGTNKYQQLFHESMVRIIGGNELETGDFPWVVKVEIVFSNSKNASCTGSVISPNYILTAKHCTNAKDGDDFPVKEIQIQYGSAKVAELKSLTSTQWFHSSGDNIYGEDIALVKLDTPIEYDEGVSAICLSRSKRATSGEKAIASGYGNIFKSLISPIGAGQDVFTNMTYNLKADILNAVAIDIMDIEKCACEDCGGSSILEKSEFCAGGKQQGTFIGDSGGPVMVLDKSMMQWFQVGITARGHLSSTDEESKIIDFGTYTTVAQFCDWIEQTTNNEVTCAT